MANGLVGRVWEHPWQIMRRMWQMGIKTFLNSNWQPSCYLRRFFLLQVEPLHYVWKMEVQVTLHPFHIVSPCPCVPCSSSPLSVCSQDVFSQQLMWTLLSWVKSAWGSIGGRAWGLSLNAWPWLLMKNRI